MNRADLFGHWFPLIVIGFVVFGLLGITIRREEKERDSTRRYLVTRSGSREDA
jgi:hypothetical protein